MGILYPDAQVKGFSGLRRMAPDSKAILDNLAESLIDFALFVLGFFVLVFFDSLLMDIEVQKFDEEIFH